MNALSIAVVSGKGGVGKTSISLNLGLALARAGKRVLLADCDLGLANVDVLLGATPRGTLQDVINGECDALHACFRVCPGLDIVPSASGTAELAALGPSLPEKLATALAPLLAGRDYLLLDLGAGISPTVLRIARMAHLRLVIVNPEPTAVTDGYALIKVLSQSGTDNFACVINSVMDKTEAGVTRQRLSAACTRFLGIEPAFLGAIPMDAHVPESVCRQTPLLEAFPDCPAARAVSALAGQVEALRKTMIRQGAAGEPVLAFEQEED